MLKGRLLERKNRFVMLVELASGGETVEAYCPNTSRLIGLLDGSPLLLLTRAESPDRRTDYTVRCIEANDTWVGIVAHQANEIFANFLETTSLQPYASWSGWDREVDLGGKPVDFRGLTEAGEKHWVEVKSLSSRWRDGSSFYSGTPSRRAYRQLEELGRSVREGDRADCVFVVQRPDVGALKPAPVTEPDWIDALESARTAGVSLRSFRCRRGSEGWSVDREIPAVL